MTEAGPGKMPYIALYRKYRPQRFEEVVGQPHIVRTLVNAVNSKRIAHAYLFAGPRGTGKTTMARLLAKALNCVNGPTPKPCGKCPPCVHIQEGTSLDVLEIDAASNRGIDEIRELRERVRFSPVEGRYRVYIVDEVHMLTTEAFNALLKTLEEPPQHVIFVLCTTEPHRVLPTILSRCIRFDFRPVPVDSIRKRVKEVAKAEGIEIEEAAVDSIARAAEGSVRDALSILEQLVAYSEGRITADLVREALGATDIGAIVEFADAMLDGDIPGALSVVARAFDSGRDPAQFLRDIASYLRDVLLFQTCDNAPDLVRTPRPWHPDLERHASAFDRGALVSALEILARAEQELRWNSQHRLVVELATLRLCSRGGEVTSTGSAPKPARTRSPKESPSSKEEDEEEPHPAERIRKILGKSTEAQAEGKQPEPQRPEEAPPQPSPKEEPRAGAGPPGELTVDFMADNWGRVVDALRKRKAPLMAVAVAPHLKPKELSDNTLVLQPETEFHLAQFREANASEEFASAVEEAFGRRLEIRVEAPEGATPLPSGGRLFEESQSQARKRRREPSEVVQEVLDLFGGEVVSNTSEGG